MPAKRQLYQRSPVDFYGGPAAPGMRYSGYQTSRSRKGNGKYRAVNTGELKFHDIAVDDASIAQLGIIQNAGTINIIPQGTTDITRIGRKVTIKSISWRYQLEIPANATAGLTDTVRMIMYLDKQCNKATASSTDILETDDYQSFRNLTNTGRFQILHDETYTLTPPSAAGNGTANDNAGVQVNVAWYKKCNITIEWTGTTGVINTCTSNNLCVMTVAKTGAIMALESNVRLRFSDGK